MFIVIKKTRAFSSLRVFFCSIHRTRMSPTSVAEKFRFWRNFYRLLLDWDSALLPHNDRNELIQEGKRRLRRGEARVALTYHAHHVYVNILQHKWSLCTAVADGDVHNALVSLKYVAAKANRHSVSNVTEMMRVLVNIITDVAAPSYHADATLCLSRLIGAKESKDEHSDTAVDDGRIRAFFFVGGEEVVACLLESTSVTDRFRGAAMFLRCCECRICTPKVAALISNHLSPHVFATPHDTATAVTTFVYKGLKKMTEAEDGAKVVLQHTFPHVMRSLSSPTTAYVPRRVALEILGNICATSDPGNTDAFIDADGIDVVISLVHGYPKLARECMWLLSNVAAGNPRQARSLFLHPRVVPTAIQLMEFGVEADMSVECAWLICNLSSNIVVAPSDISTAAQSLMRGLSLVTEWHSALRVGEVGNDDARLQIENALRISSSSSRGRV